MNLDLVRKNIIGNKNKTVQVVVYGMRNKVSRYLGKIDKIYPNLFTLFTETGEKSFTYSDVATGEVKIKILE